MGQWVWDSDSDSRGFMVRGPLPAEEIWQTFGHLFPLDSPIRWWPTLEDPPQALYWRDVKEITLGPQSQIELPANPEEVGPLIYVVQRLLSDNGCPWDRQQTSLSLLPYLLDESYEAAEALIADDLDSFQAELGDVLLQVVFHSALLSDAHLDQVVSRAVQKLIRRHPHVFADAQAANAEAVKEQWEKIKAEETHSQVAATWVYPSLVMAKRQGKQGHIPQSTAFQSVIDFMQVYIANNPGTLENILADAAWAIAEVGRQQHLDVEWALWRRIVSLNRPSELG